MFVVFIKHLNQKRGGWSPPGPVLVYDLASGAITSPSPKALAMSATSEDDRPSSCDELFAFVVRKTNDLLDAEIFDLLKSSTVDNDQCNGHSKDFTNETNPAAPPNRNKKTLHAFGPDFNTVDDEWVKKVPPSKENSTRGTVDNISLSNITTADD